MSKTNSPPPSKKKKGWTNIKRVTANKTLPERIEINLQGKLTSNTQRNLFHSTIPGLNFNKKPWVEQWDVENALNLYGPYPYACDLPKPLLPPAKIRRHIHAQHDPATDLMFTKKFIQDDTEVILDNFQTNKKAHTMILKKDVQWTGTKYDRGETSLPRYIAVLADIIEMDPDPYFEGKYNWYYTGGSISNINFNDSNLLIFPFMKDLVVTPINFKNMGLWKPDLSKATKYTIDNPLYEIRHLVSSDSCRILARCKYECIFYSLTTKDNQLSLVALDNKASKLIPFISADLNPIDHNQYCTLNVGRMFERCDMVSGKCLSKGHIDTEKDLSDNWGSIKYNPSNPNIIALTDRNALHYMDLRVSLETPTVTMCPKYKLDNCDNLSLHMPSERSSRHYLGTFHSFLMVDDRSPDQCIHQKWTHMLRSPPLTGATYMHEGEEVIVISNQLASEASIIINTWQNFDDPHSYHLPYAAPTIVDTLKQSQLIGRCLDPLLTAQVELSSVGSTLLFHDNHIYYFTQNSMEDVFYSCITYNGEQKNLDIINDYASHALQCWEREMLKNQEKSVAPLALTDRVNMEHIFKKFSDTKLKYKLVEEENYLPEYWRQPLDKLREYVDIMAPLLLEAWDFPEDNDGKPNVPDVSEPHEQRIMDWLKKSEDVLPPEENLPASQVLYDDYVISSTPVLTQELISVSQQHNEPNSEIQMVEIRPETVDLVESFDNLTTNTKGVKSRKEKKKAKSTYTDGF